MACIYCSEITNIFKYMHNLVFLRKNDWQPGLKMFVWFCPPWSLVFHSKGLQASRDLPVFSKRGFAYVRNVMSSLSGEKEGLLCSSFYISSKIHISGFFFCHRDSPYISSTQGRERTVKNFLLLQIIMIIEPETLNFLTLYWKHTVCLSFVDIKSCKDIKRKFGFSC